MHVPLVRKNATSQDLTIHHLDLSRFELWVARIIWIAPFNSRALVVIEVIVKNREVKFLKIYHFSISKCARALPVCDNGKNGIYIILTGNSVDVSGYC